MTTKKHAVYGFLALVSLLTLGITQSARGCAENLVTNGGFETGDLTGWTWTTPNNPPGATLAVFAPPYGTISPHEGIWQAILGPDGSDGTLSQNLTTTGGAHYVIDFWLWNYGTTLGPSDFSVKWGTTGTLLSLTNPPHFDYTEYTFNVIGDPGTTTLEFDFRNDAAFFLLDDISVCSVTAPDAGSTLPLLGFALAGLGILRRKLRC